MIARLVGAARDRTRALLATLRQERIAARTGERAALQARLAAADALARSLADALIIAPTAPRDAGGRIPRPHENTEEIDR